MSISMLLASLWLAFGQAAQAAVPLVPYPIALDRGGRTPLAVRTADIPAHPLHLIIMGPPGVGKGTQSDKIVADFGPAHISSGDLLREKAKTDPKLAAILNQGQLVPLETVVAIMEERLKQPDVRQRGFLLDGFPRRVSDAEAMMQMLGRLGLSLDGVIRLELPQDVLEQRVLGRGRSDDNAKTFQRRMQVYFQQTVPVYDYLKGKAPIVSPDANGTVDQVYQHVHQAIEQLIAAK